MFAKQIVNSKNKDLGLTLLNPASNVYLFHNTRNKALIEHKTFLWHLQGQHFIKKNTDYVEILPWKWIIVMMCQDFCNIFIMMNSKIWTSKQKNWTDVFSDTDRLRNMTIYSRWVFCPLKNRLIPMHPKNCVFFFILTGKTIPTAAMVTSF